MLALVLLGIEHDSWEINTLQKVNKGHLTKSWSMSLFEYWWKGDMKALRQFLSQIFETTMRLISFIIYIYLWWVDIHLGSLYKSF